MLSDSEKRVYNNHLAISRKVKGQPFKLRQDFSKFDENKIPIIQRLTRWFENYPTVNMDIFFIAPYKVFPDEDYYPLEYYITPKALKTYTTYVRNLELEDPDSIESLERLRDTLKFIFLFCSEKGLTLSEYASYSEQSIPCWLAHLKDHKITFYTVHALTISKPSVESRILDFMFTDFYGVFQKTRNKFYNSVKMREFAKLAKLKIETKLNE